MKGRKGSGRKREKEAARAGGREEGREGEKRGRKGSWEHGREEGKYLDDYILDRYYHDRGWNSKDFDIPMLEIFATCAYFIISMYDFCYKNRCKIAALNSLQSEIAIWNV